MNAPALAGFAGTDKLNPGNTSPMCDAVGNCSVQRILENTQQPSEFFVPYVGYTTIDNKQNTAVSSYNALQSISGTPRVTDWLSRVRTRGRI